MSSTQGLERRELYDGTLYYSLNGNRFYTDDKDGRAYLKGIKVYSDGYALLGVYRDMHCTDARSILERQGFEFKRQDVDEMLLDIDSYYSDGNGRTVHINGDDVYVSSVELLLE